MAEEKAKPVEAAAETPEKAEPEKVADAAGLKMSAEVVQTQLEQKQQTLDACVAKGGPELQNGQTLLQALTSSEVDKKLGGDCAGTDLVANLRKQIGPAPDGQPVKIETRPDGSRIETRFENGNPVLRLETQQDGSSVESRFENGRLTSQRSIKGDIASLKMFDDKGNLTTTLLESGTGADKVQMWTFADGDNLRIRADGTFNGTINGRAIDGKGKAEIEAFFREALADNNFKPDLSRDSFGADTHGTSMIISGDNRTGAIVSKSGELNILTSTDTGNINRNTVTFSGDTMILQGPQGALTVVKGTTDGSGLYTFTYNGITYTAQDGKFQGMSSVRGDVTQTVTKGPNGWRNEAVETPKAEDGTPLTPNRVVTSTNDKGEVISTVMAGDKPVQTTVTTLENRTTYKGDGTDRSPENIIMRATDNKVETPEIVRQGNMVYDRTGAYSDKDPFGAGVYYDVVSGRNLTNTQLLQFASFAAAMSSQVSSFQNYFETVSTGANNEMGSIEGKIGQIQAFIGYVNCNVNGSRFASLLVPANTALISGFDARARAGVVVPDRIATESGLRDPGLEARTANDIRLSPSSLMLINGGKHYEEVDSKTDGALPPLQLIRKKN